MAISNISGDPVVLDGDGAVREVGRGAATHLRLGNGVLMPLGTEPRAATEPRLEKAPEAIPATGTTSRP